MVSHIHIHSLTHPLTLTHSRPNILSHPHRLSPSYILTYTHTFTHSRPHIPSHTHTHLHTSHTYTPSCLLHSPFLSSASDTLPLPYIYTPQVLQHPATSSCCKTSPKHQTFRRKPSSAPPSCGTTASEVLEDLHNCSTSISLPVKCCCVILKLFWCWYLSYMDFNFCQAGLS